MSGRTGPVDRDEARFFVYFLSDDAGEVIYVGRSRDVAMRLRAHYCDASNPDITQSERKALWLMDVRSVDVIGPFTWNGAVAEERRHIKRLEPYGNIQHTRRNPALIANGVRRARVLKAAS